MRLCCVSELELGTDVHELKTDGPRSFNLNNTAGCQEIQVVGVNSVLVDILFLVQHLSIKAFLVQR